VEHYTTGESSGVRTVGPLRSCSVEPDFIQPDYTGLTSTWHDQRISLFASSRRGGRRIRPRLKSIRSATRTSSRTLTHPLENDPLINCAPNLLIKPSNRRPCTITTCTRICYTHYYILNACMRTTTSPIPHYDQMNPCYCTYSQNCARLRRQARVFGLKSRNFGTCRVVLCMHLGRFLLQLQQNGTIGLKLIHGKPRTHGAQ